MRRVRIVALCIVGACAGTALAASTASAALPELGRCVPEPKHEGVFTKSNCIGVAAKHNGAFEFEPGPGAEKAFIERIGNPIFETVGGKRIGCTTAFIEGEYTGAKTLKISHVTINGCVLVGPNLSCQTNPLEAGVIESVQVDLGELGFIPGSKTAATWVGWDLKPEPPATSLLSQFACGEGLNQVVVEFEGSVIGRVVKPNKMTTTFEPRYHELKGVQIPTSFIGGPEDVLTEKLKPLPPALETVEQVGLKNPTGGIFENKEPLEIKAKI
jgi:hypothetical protein